MDIIPRRSRLLQLRHTLLDEFIVSAEVCFDMSFPVVTPSCNIISWIGRFDLWFITVCIRCVQHKYTSCNNGIGSSRSMCFRHIGEKLSFLSLCNGRIEPPNSGPCPTRPSRRSLRSFVFQSNPSSGSTCQLHSRRTIGSSILSHSAGFRNWCSLLQNCGHSESV